jgi:cytokinin dehydrogenase
MSTVQRQLAADLHRASGAWASGETSDLAPVSMDFGGLTRKWPAVVVRPSNTAEVAEVMRYASRLGVPVTVRGAGHSIGGQTLNQGGILLDTRLMSRVSTPNVDALWIDLEPGAEWTSVVDMTRRHGLVPPVLTGALSTSVGGTHSVGGMGHASHLYGTQADNCIGLEVVTADGDVHWCDADVESSLFEHVLCGLGQFGVITRVRHRLRPYRPFTRRWRLLYAQLREMLRDLEILATSTPRPAHLAGYGFAVNGRFGYSIGTAFEMDDEHDVDDEAVLATLSPTIKRGPIAQPFREFAEEQPLPDARGPRASSSGLINPWIDLLLPAARARPMLDEALACFSPRLLRGATMLFWPMFREHLTRPLFMVPDAERIIMAGVYMTVPDTERPSALAALTDATESLMAGGGKRYAYAWMPFDRSGWARHYGPHWPTVCRLKEQYDPQGILNRGIVQYGVDHAAPAYAEVS